MPNTLTPLPRDAEGILRLPGTPSEPLTIDFTRATSVPATVTAANGALGGTPAKGTGYLRLTATNGNTASLAFAGAVDPTAKAALVTFDCRFGQNGWTTNSLFMGFEGGTSGITWRGHSRTLQARVSGSPPALPAPLTYWGGDSTIGYRAARINLSLLIIPGRKIGALLVGDQVVTAATMSEMAVAADMTAQIVAQVSDGSSTLLLDIFRARLQQWW